MKLLKTLREKAGMTQQQVADTMGITRAAYSKWENGEREPDNATVVKLADLFSVTTDYLLERPLAVISYGSDKQADSVEKVRVAMEQALKRPISREGAETMLHAYDRLTSLE